MIACVYMYHDQVESLKLENIPYFLVSHVVFRTSCWKCTNHFFLCTAHVCICFHVCVFMCNVCVHGLKVY